MLKTPTDQESCKKQGLSKGREERPFYMPKKNLLPMKRDQEEEGLEKVSKIFFMEQGKQSQLGVEERKEEMVLERQVGGCDYRGSWRIAWFNFPVPNDVSSNKAWWQQGGSMISSPRLSYILIDRFPSGSDRNRNKIK